MQILLFRFFWSAVSFASRIPVRYLRLAYPEFGQSEAMRDSEVVACKDLTVKKKCCLYTYRDLLLTKRRVGERLYDKATSAVKEINKKESFFLIYKKEVHKFGVSIQEDCENRSSLVHDQSVSTIYPRAGREMD